MLAAFNYFCRDAVLTRGFSTHQSINDLAELLQCGLGVQLFKNRQVLSVVKHLLGDGIFPGVDVEVVLNPSTHPFVLVFDDFSSFGLKQY